mmetsp:Transcript_13480/g.19712  ORF Transcript_13480/g.19712 Transcript_13480/m.19712 type:complete len:107 (+) Transcript_13480:1751-2071(+)
MQHHLGMGFVTSTWGKTLLNADSMDGIVPFLTSTLIVMLKMNHGLETTGATAVNTIRSNADMMPEIASDEPTRRTYCNCVGWCHESRILYLIQSFPNLPSPFCELQ